MAMGKGVGVLTPDVAEGVICGVMGLCSSILGLAMVAAARILVWPPSRRRFGASLTFGCVWH